MRQGTRRSRSGLLVTALLAATALAAACDKKEPPKMPPPVVEVAPVVQKDVPIYQEWIGTLDGFVNAEIRPQVEGYLLRQVYQEGSLVRKGDPLFEIDPRQFQAAYDQAKGNLAQYQARSRTRRRRWRATRRWPPRRRSASRSWTTP